MILNNSWPIPYALPVIFNSPKNDFAIRVVESRTELNRPCFSF